MQWRVQKDGRRCKSSRGSSSSSQHMQLASGDHSTDPTTTISSFFKDDRKISIGDCALFESPQDSPPFIGLIRCLRLNKEKNLQLGVNRLYRTAELKPTSGNLIDTPNEVFYSSYKDEAPAASLLHPCKVAFLPRGVNLPEEKSSFVCRRIYDISNKCLWWLTDQNFTDELQKEVDWLLNKTRIEMHTPQQPADRSPKQVNRSSSTSPLTSASESGQSTNLFTSQLKGKKRARLENGTEHHVKRGRSLRSDGCNVNIERTWKYEISKITENGGLVGLEGVEKLVQIMQSENIGRKLDLAGRSMVASVIAATDKVDCLIHFLQLRGLPVMDQWLQELHKGNSAKDSDRSTDEFLLMLLCALDKLPVDLHALQMCNIGRSVNHLRSHKNLEIQRKARSLVDTWKKRVQAEMSSMDAKNNASKSSSPKSSHGENNMNPATSSPLPVKRASSPAFCKESKSENRSSSSDQSHHHSQTILRKDDPKRSTACSLSEKTHKASASTSKVAFSLNEKVCKGPVAEQSSHKLIVKIPNRVGGPILDVSDESRGLLTESAVPNDDRGMTSESAKTITDAPTTNELDSRKLDTPPFSSINVLIESCVNNSDANSSMSFEDDVGINLLASVAAGEISRCNLVYHSKSPDRDNITAEGVYNSDEPKPVSSPREYKVEDPSPVSKHILDVEKVRNDRSNDEIHEKSTSSNVTTDDSNCKSDGNHVMMTEEKSSIDISNDVHKVSIGVAASSDSCEVESERELSEESKVVTTKQRVSKSAFGEKAKSGKVQQTGDSQVSIPESDTLVNAESLQTASSTQPEGAVECSVKTSSSAGASTSDMGVKMAFDLNERFCGDDGNYNEVPSAPTTVNILDNATRLPVPPVLSGHSAPGSFFKPPLLSTKMSFPDASTSKQNRSLLDIDLNVPDERLIAEIASRDSMSIAEPTVDNTSMHAMLQNKIPSSEPVRSSVWLDFDLNRADETSDIAYHPTSNNRKVECSSEHVKPLNGLPTNIRGDFDLNNGPGNDDTISTKQFPITPQINGVPQPQFSSAGLGVNMNSPVMGNFSSWFRPGNNFSNVAVPSMLPDRRAQQFPFYSGGGPFNPDIYRGQVLSSSPAMPFQFPVFPYGTNFHLPPAAYTDFASGPGLFAPQMNPQLFQMPYNSNPMNRIDNSGLENRNSAREVIDLNTGLGGREPEILAMSSSAQNSQVLIEEHARIRAGISRRKEADGSWENENFRYRQSPWHQ